MPTATPLRPRFLVADDDPVVAQGVAEVLAEAGADVVGLAPDGAQALQLWLSTQPDAAVLDFEMPGLTGLQVLQAIRSHERQHKASRPCLVVIFSSHAEPSIAEQCLVDGADLFLNKHADLDRLCELPGGMAGRLRQVCRQSAHSPSA